MIAAFIYFAIVFAAGFVLGSLRVLWLAGAVGEAGAVILEVPLMLAVSWVAAGWCITRFAVPATWPARLAMGALAFALLMAAETVLALAAFGRTPAAMLAHYATAPGLIGLAGQVVFALIPALRLRVSG